MNWIIGILFIAALVYIGIDYGRLVYKSKCEEQVISYEPYTPIRHIFVLDALDSPVRELYDASMNARRKAGIEVL